MPWWIWTAFVVFITALVLFDLVVLHRKTHTISVREALGWTGVWISVALGFNVLVYFLYEDLVPREWLGSGAIGVQVPRLADGADEARVERVLVAEGAMVELKEPVARLAVGDTERIVTAHEAGRVGEIHVEEGDVVEPGDTLVNLQLTGKQAALQFFTGYLIEYSLSVDNIFVIALIITAFRVPSQYQHRLLFWGVLGAAVLRGIMIGVGTVLIMQFSWIIYVFGVLLILSAVKLLFSSEGEVDPEHSFAIRMTRRLYPVTHEFHGKDFFVDLNGRRTATPMLLALVLIESSDVMFAVDSIPAVFAVTRDPFLVFTSNIFAILGLRSLYFALAGLMDKFRYLKLSLVFVLAFVGVKMLLSHSPDYKIPNGVSLAVIAGLLAVGVIASLAASARDERKTARHPAAGDDNTESNGDAG
jgi:tellurite resistance protein TerC